MQLVLGVNSNATATLVDRESLRGGAAAVRLSWTLNRYGGRHAIGRHPVVLSGHGKDSFIGADGQQYIFRNEAFGPYLAARYGDPVVQRLKADRDADDQGRRRPRRRRRPSWPAVVGRQGIVRVVRYAGGREDGHVGLWDCDRFHESRDWSLDTHVIAVEFWEAAGSCRFYSSDRAPSQKGGGYNGTTFDFHPPPPHRVKNVTDSRLVVGVAYQNFLSRTEPRLLPRHFAFTHSFRSSSLRKKNFWYKYMKSNNVLICRLFVNKATDE